VQSSGKGRRNPPDAGRGSETLANPVLEGKRRRGGDRTGGLALAET
jgi:hypothetical protein